MVTAVYILASPSFRSVTREWRVRRPPATSIGTRVMTDLDAVRGATTITQRLSCGQLSKSLVGVIGQL
jgi:hypothetical protein